MQLRQFYIPQFLEQKTIKFSKCLWVDENNESNGIVDEGNDGRKKKGKKLNYIYWIYNAKYEHTFLCFVFFPTSIKIRLEIF